MKRFENFTLYPRINDAIKDAEIMFSHYSGMLKEIALKNDWKFNSGTGQEIAAKLFTKQGSIGIFTYKSTLPWSKARGYFDGESIHINTRKINGLSHADLVGLLCHEFSHFAGFTHGSNWQSEDKNLYSVPYFISSNITRWL